MLLAALLSLTLQTTAPFDENTTISELTALAEAGNVEAQSELGVRLQFEWIENNGDPDDEAGLVLLDLARYWLERAAEGNDTNALNALGTLYQQGVGVEYDPVRAQGLFRQAAEAGHMAAILNLSAMEIHDEDAGNDAAAVERLEALIRRGEDPQLAIVASGLLGMAYTFGEGEVDQDYDHAFELLEFADSTGEAGATVLFLLGRYHETGVGGADGGESTALIYFQRAALAGHGSASWKAGMQHLNGWGTPVDQAEAFRWVYRAAELGDIQGMISTAVMLAMGQGAEIDFAQSRYWYNQAANTGNVHAIRALGMMDVIGQGGPVNTERGVALLELSAAAGDRNAAILLEQFEQPDTSEFRNSVDRAGEEWLAERGLSVSDLYGAQQ